MKKYPSNTKESIQAGIIAGLFMGGATFISAFLIIGWIFISLVLGIIVFIGFVLACYYDFKEIKYSENHRKKKE
jgi:O-antigen/teichoic acid export membrane protein